MKSIKLIILQIKMNLLFQLQYKKNIIIQVFFSLFEFIFIIATLEIIYMHVTSIKSWTREEILLIIGTYYIVDGLVRSVIAPSLKKFMQGVGTGNFDFVLLRPVDSRFWSKICVINIWESVNIMIGIVITFYAYFQITITFNILFILAYLLFIVLGFSIIINLYTLLATVSFWFINVAELVEIFPQFLQTAGKWPISIYPNWLKLIFTFIIPIGVAITFSVEALLGSFSFLTFLIGVGVAFAMYLLSKVVWIFGLKKYNSASS